jgi:hypothetical protein
MSSFFPRNRSRHLHYCVTGVHVNCKNCSTRVNNDDGLTRCKAEHGTYNIITKKEEEEEFTQKWRV